MHHSNCWASLPFQRTPGAGPPLEEPWYGTAMAQGDSGWAAWRGVGGWHEASISICLPLAVPIGLSPLLILTLCGPERVLVVCGEGGGGGHLPPPLHYVSPPAIPAAILSMLDPDTGREGLCGRRERREGREQGCPEGAAGGGGAVHLFRVFGGLLGSPFHSERFGRLPVGGYGPSPYSPGMRGRLKMQPDIRSA